MQIGEYIGWNKNIHIKDFRRYVWYKCRSSQKVKARHLSAWFRPRKQEHNTKGLRKAHGYHSE